MRTSSLLKAVVLLLVLMVSAPLSFAQTSELSLPRPHVALEGSSLNIVVPQLASSGTDVTSVVQTDASSWGGSNPVPDLSGDWTCSVLNNDGSVSSSYTVTLRDDGVAEFPGQAYVDGSWSYSDSKLGISHTLLSGDSWSFDTYDLSTTTPTNPSEFSGTRERNYGNWITSNTSTAKVTLTYNGTLPSLPVFSTADGRSSMAVVANESETETTGPLLQQRISGLQNGYYVVELYASSTATVGTSDDITYLFANNTRLFIPLSGDTNLSPDNVYELGTEVTDGTLTLGLGKAALGATYHQLQVKSLQLRQTDAANPETGATVRYTLDGTVPTASSPEYSAPLSLTHNCTVSAMASMDGRTDSEVATFEVGGLTWGATVPAPVISYDGDVVSITVPGIVEDTSTDVTSRVATAATAWGGTEPVPDLTGSWTCHVYANGDLVDEYTVILNANGEPSFPGQAYESGSWGYDNGSLSISHWKIAGGAASSSYNYDVYTLTTTTPLNPMEFTGTKLNTYGNEYVENNVSRDIVLTYDGTSFGMPLVDTADGRTVAAALVEEVTGEKTGTLMEQTLSGLDNGYYTVELCAKSYSGVATLATDVAYLFANDTRLFIPIEGDKELKEHNQYRISVAVTDGSLHLGLGKAQTGATYHVLQIKSLTLNAIDESRPLEGAHIYYTLDGTEPTEQSLLYTEPFTVTENGAVNAIAAKDGYVSSPVSTLDVDWLEVAPVSISVSNLELTMTTATDDATIYYTLDGSEPDEDNGTPYTAAIALSTLPDACVVQARAYRDDLNPSAISSYQYARAAFVTPTPEISLDRTSQQATITCEAAGATIFYTLDGSDPTPQSTVYTAPFTLTQNGVVKAFAAQDGFFSSEIATAEADWFEVAPVSISISNLELTMTTATADATIYYTLDGGDPDEGTGTPYTAAIALSTLPDACEVRARAFKDGLIPSSVESFQYSRADYVASTPVITLDQYVLTISSETANAAIYYTLDGSTPTEQSTLYNGPFTLTEDCTVNAIASGDGYLASDVATYTVDWINMKSALFEQLADCSERLAVLRHLLEEKATQAQAPRLYEMAADIAEAIATTESGLEPVYSRDELYDFEYRINEIHERLHELESEIEAFTVVTPVTDERVETPVMALDYATGVLTISCATADSEIFYSIGSSSVQSYNAPLALTDNSTVTCWAVAPQRQESAEASLTPIVNGQALGTTFTIRGEVTAAELLFLRNIMGSQVEHLDLTEAQLADGGLPDEAFSAMSLITARLPYHVSAVGARLFSGCRRLAAVVWNAADTDITSAALAGTGNPNMLLYVGVAGQGLNAGITNRVAAGVAETIVLSDPTAATSAMSDNNFFAPEPFLARSISYSHVYWQTTGLDGHSQGWETIALPFTVQTVTHRVKGAVTPFGSTGAKPHFWLRSFGIGGFETATTIEANHPYIIAMPQHDDYAAQYCLGQDTITFAATNAQVAATAPQSQTNGTKTLHANFIALDASQDIYAINIQDAYDDTHPEGSIFLPARRSVRPFEAYTTITGAPVRFISLFADDEANGIMAIQQERQAGTDTVYDLQGRRVSTNRGTLQRKRMVISNGKVRTDK